MMIYIIRERATPQQMQEMLQALGTYIKLAVDIPLINIRPRQNNRAMEILDPEIRGQVAQITCRLLGEK